MSLLTQVEAYCRQHNLITSGDTIVVALSGGPDSLALTLLLRMMSAQWGLKLHLAHLNHQLRRPASDEDAQFVAQLAADWALPVTLEAVDVAGLAQTHKLSLEEAGRQARYQFLAQVAMEVGASKIAVAHHAGDQAETILMHFLRGAGLAGLRGMTSTALLLSEWLPAGVASPPLLIRPLLATTRAEIEAFVQTLDVTPRYDVTNDDTAIYRNRIRHELLPLLETYNPNIRQLLSQTGTILAGDYAVVQQRVDRAWKFVRQSVTANKITFDLNDWEMFSPAIHRYILRRGIQTLNHNQRNVTFEHLEQALMLLKHRRTGAKLDLPGHLTLEIDYKGFSLSLKEAPLPVPLFPYLPAGTPPVPLLIGGTTLIPQTPWRVETTLLIPSTLDDYLLQQNDPWQAYFDADRVGWQPVLRPRRPGERFYPFGLQGHRQEVKAYMINRKIPAGWRGQVPLLVSAEEVICWVCGWRTDQRSRVTPKTNRVLRVRFSQ